MSKTNPFIVIEALDAGGSQTQTDLLVQRLRKENYEVMQLHFPQEDRATGRLIYDKFLLPKNKRRFSRREQALLYIQDFYSRADDITIARTSRERKIVVSDRYCTSTMAYQTIGLSGKQRAAMLDWLTWLTYEGTPALPKPDLVIFLDTPVKVSLERLEHKKKDWFETKAKLSAIRRSYTMLARDQRWRIIESMDTDHNVRTREDLHAEVWKAVYPLLD